MTSGAQPWHKLKQGFRLSGCATRWGVKCCGTDAAEGSHLAVCTSSRTLQSRMSDLKYTSVYVQKLSAACGVIWSHQRSWSAMTGSRACLRHWNLLDCPAHLVPPSSSRQGYPSHTCLHKHAACVLISSACHDLPPAGRRAASKEDDRSATTHCGHSSLLPACIARVHSPTSLTESAHSLAAPLLLCCPHQRSTHLVQTVTLLLPLLPAFHNNMEHSHASPIAGINLPVSQMWSIHSDHDCVIS